MMPHPFYNVFEKAICLCLFVFPQQKAAFLNQWKETVSRLHEINMKNFLLWDDIEVERLRKCLNGLNILWTC